MNLPAEQRLVFDALVLAPLGDIKDLRTRVAEHYAAAAEDAARRGLVDPERFVAFSAGVDAVLKAITRKTSPLHARMLHAVGLWVLRDDPTSHRASRERLESDLAVIGEVLRITRRLHLVFQA